MIEKLTGKPYDVSVRRSVLAPRGITDMVIAGNTLAERRTREVVYYSQGGDTSPYSMNVRRMDSHGGWIARPIDLVRFLTHVDGFSPHQLLRPGTIKVMTTPTTANANYAKGWAVNSQDNCGTSAACPGPRRGSFVRIHGSAGRSSPTRACRTPTCSPTSTTCRGTWRARSTVAAVTR